MVEYNNYQHYLDLYVDNKLYKKLQWKNKDKFKKCYLEDNISLPNRLCDVQIEYTNNFSKDRVELDLWNDFEINKNYAPWPYEHEEFLRFDTIVNVEDISMRLFLAASHKINDTTDFNINNLVLEKAKICTCGAINPSRISYYKNKITGCNNCE